MASLRLHLPVRLVSVSRTPRRTPKPVLPRANEVIRHETASYSANEAAMLSKATNLEPQ
jgi:hypothetical protein